MLNSFPSFPHLFIIPTIPLLSISRIVILQSLHEYRALVMAYLGISIMGPVRHVPSPTSPQWLHILLLLLLSEIPANNIVNKIFIEHSLHICPSINPQPAITLLRIVTPPPTHFKLKIPLDCFPERTDLAVDKRPTQRICFSSPCRLKRTIDKFQKWFRSGLHTSPVFCVHHHRSIEYTISSGWLRMNSKSPLHCVSPLFIPTFFFLLLWVGGQRWLPSSVFVVLETVYGDYGSSLPPTTRKRGQPVVSICRCHKYPADFSILLFFFSSRLTFV